jgi:hypothetical protein
MQIDMERKMDDTDNSGFVRQRRNLMFISLVLLFSEVADLRIPKLSVFGNELDFSEPYAVNAALWVAACYWLLRFYQYSPRSLSPLKSFVYQRVFATAIPAALSTVLREKPELRERFVDLPAAEPIFTAREEQIWGFTSQGLDIELAVDKSATSGNATCTVDTGKHRTIVKGWDLRRLQWRAWIYLIFRTPLFTEYLLPYLLFALPVIFAAYQGIGIWLEGEME